MMCKNRNRSNGSRAVARWPVGGVVRLVLLVVASLHAGSIPANAADIAITQIDGTAVTGRWLGFQAGEGLKLATDDGPQTIPIDDIMAASLPGSSEEAVDVGSEARETASPATVFLADGGLLPGTFLGGSDEAVQVTTALGASLELPMAMLAGLRFAEPGEYQKAESLYKAALNHRLPGSDVLVTREVDEPKVLRGRLDSLGPESGSFTLGKRTRTVRLDRIYGFVFASGVRCVDPLPVRIELRDGSVFTGRIEHADERTLVVATSLAVKATLPISGLKRLDVTSARVVYLSDQEPARTKVTGRVHRSREISRDRGLTGQGLSLGGRQYDKGIACHSLSEISYELSEPFAQFVADIGVDDEMAGRGSVVFRVVGDGKELFASGLMTGRDAPKPVRVTIEGVKELTLVVDYGDELDVSDHAVWGGARLLRP